MDPREQGIQAVQLAARIAAPFLSPVWQAALASLDTFGGYLGRQFSEIARQQLDAFREDLRAELARTLERAGTPRQFLEAQSLGQLILRASEAVIIERDAAKRKAYARLICRADSPGWSAHLGRVEQALRALVDASEEDFALLRAVLDRSQIVNEPTPSAGELSADILGPMLPSFDVERIRAHLARLERLGLIREQRGDSTELWSSNNVRYVSTPLLRDLASLLVDQTDSASPSAS